MRSIRRNNFSNSAAVTTDLPASSLSYGMKSASRLTISATSLLRKTPDMGIVGLPSPSYHMSQNHSWSPSRSTTYSSHRDHGDVGVAGSTACGNTLPAVGHAP